DMASGALLIAKVVVRDADHPLADKSIALVKTRHHQGSKLLRQGQSGAVIDTVDMKGPQTPEGALLVLRITEALRKLQGFCPGRGHFRNAASGIEPRRAQGGKKLHLQASIRLGDSCQCSECLLDAAAA